MNVLVIDDEVGIREGVAAFLRLQGHRVETAGELADALDRLEHGDFDVAITDWRVGREDALPVLERARCPCLVISGFPEDVRSGPALHKVLAKPIDLECVVAEVEALGGDIVRSNAPSLELLPIDTRARLRLALALLGDPEDVEIVDEGPFVTLFGPLRDESVLPHVELCGGDVRVLCRNDLPWLELRINRDSRPEAVERTLRPGEPWPDDDRPIAIDLHGQSISPRSFSELVQRVDDARQAGRSVSLLNVPEHLRFFVEALGRASQMPMRPIAGPRLPEVLSELWR